MASLSLDDYSARDGLGLAELLDTGQVSEAELLDTAREAIAAVNGELNALAFPLFEAPLDHSADAPFSGVPFLIKDVGPYAEGVPFSVGSKLFEGAVAAADAEVMRRFRAAGLATIGSTAVPEMAISFATESRRQGATCNPWDLTRGVGGSSGGAAALVAAGAVPIAHANDGAGSIRIPAAFCGLVGLKPTRGRTPVDVDTLFGLAYEFAVTRTVRDAAQLLDLVQGPEVTAKYRIAPPQGEYASIIRQDPPPLRVGLTTRAWSGVAVDRECAEAAERVARELETLGHHVEEAGPGIDSEALLRAYRAITTVAFAAVLDQSPVEPTPDLVEAVTLTVWREAAQLNALEVGRGFAGFDAVCRSAGRFFADYDLLITPTTAVPAIPHGTLTYDSPDHTVESWTESILTVGPFTAPFNIGGQPAVSLPLAESATGLPIGVQLVAGYGREDHLFQVSAQLEKALPWADRRPSVHAHGVS